MDNIHEIIKSAKALGIKSTNGELCNAWIDRVAHAQIALRPR